MSDIQKFIDQMHSENLAQLMYAAYTKAARGKTFDGKPLPTWDELSIDRQICWTAAAIKAEEYIVDTFE